MPLGIALLGTGRIATNAYVPALTAINDATLVAVLSRDAVRGAQFATQHRIPATYTDLDTLLQDTRVEAVIVATPDTLHEAQVIAAVKAGKHVLCEKPMTSSVAGCLRMGDAIGASGVTFAMGYNNRFNTGLGIIKDLLEQGEIGAVRYARSFLTAAVQDPNDWRANPDQANYWAMSATGTHLIDCWRWFFGEPDSVGGALVAPVHQGANDEVSTLVLNYPGHLLAELTAAAVVQGGNRLELYGDDGAIVADNVFGPNPGGPIWCNGRQVPFTPQNPFVGQVADFIEAIRQPRPPCTTFEDGLINVRILERARSAALLHPLPST